MKNLKIILIAIIIVLLGAVVYLLARPSESREQGEYAASANKGETAMNTNAAADDFMKPHLAPMLTDAQKAELAAGKAPHSPTTLTFDITGGSFYYAPNEITVKQGDTVKIVFSNAGGVHNLTFDDPQIATKTIKGGETDTVEFKAAKKGTFEFYCSVGKGYHRMMGQIGVLLVQ